ncbi:hypothetical protein NNJEOMEG_02580 [Fundidesulfovibrio magnetotacticus]|uniref:Uncharacterized protein n=1 Tax=Fundidesulfovibrio magnetotacticus TaxID=2730080 RepID=A0A6V8LQE9_9BACT|nr:DUF389 domain-containing protein [Fundidesulfovibrio magnetotacticus]GFK94733.1 hypothetical protein NNJEOMEG_02580 [Fundidesulfovibrio magnetotacticus]
MEADSPAVIIGAMIIAMLLGPIAGVSLALVDSNTKHLLKGLATLAVGAAGVVVTALAIGVIHNDLPLTAEMLARGHHQLALGAFLLTFTNIVAIQFSSSVVLWFTGFRGISHTRGLSLMTFLKTNSVSILILAVLAVVLTNSMHETMGRKMYESTTKYALQQECLGSEGCYLADVRFSEGTGKNAVISDVVRGPNPPNPERIAAVESKMPAHPKGRPIELRVRYVPTTTITRDGVLYEGDETPHAAP